MSSQNRYLKAIYRLTSGGDEGTTTSELSDELQVSPASVSEAIQKLEEDALVCRAPYKGFTLSPMGRERARELAEKSEVLEEFFQEIGVESPGKEADRIEGSISESAVEKIRSEILDTS